MLDSILSNTAATTLTLVGTIEIILSALILGLGISLVYIFTHRKEGYSGSFTVTMIMLPAIIAMIILLVGNNVARAFSLAGAFSLIRFRSAPGDSKDIAYVFFSLAVGLACGMGYIFYGALFAAILCTVMVILWATKFGFKKTACMQLKIIMPEDLDYQGVFDDVLNEYTNSYKMVKVKTSEFGSLFEITYDVVLKNDISSKNFIDTLRCKNGNLSIVLATKENSHTTTF